MKNTDWISVIGLIVIGAGLGQMFSESRELGILTLIGRQQNTIEKMQDAMEAQQASIKTLSEAVGESACR